MKKEDKVSSKKQAVKSNNGNHTKPIKKPNYLIRAEQASAFLKANPPFEAIKAIENEQIKAFFLEGKNALQIALLMKISETDVSLRLQEIGLIEAIACV